MIVIIIIIIISNNTLFVKLNILFFHNKKGHYNVLEMVSILKFTDILILNTMSKKACPVLKNKFF